MEMSEFQYNLPEELIAQYPAKKRGSSKLLVLDRVKGKLFDDKYFNIPKYILKGDVVILNETKVLNCRTFFITPLGKKVEVLFLEEKNDITWFVLLGRAKDVNEGDILTNEEDSNFQIVVGKRKDRGFLITFKNGNAKNLFESCGHTPLPPYMKREDRPEDRIRYNTVFSEKPGAVAAPTASLNLTEDILNEIKARGAIIVKIELKIGWGTFEPVREESIEEHKVHEEFFTISKEASSRINEAILRDKRIWAFGTTVSRALESSAYFEKKLGKYLLRPVEGKTNLYIYPGYRWKVVNILVTNFHMPDSSLILLVSAFAGKSNIKKAYNWAIDNDYRFLSYGDSMLIGDNLIK